MTKLNASRFTEIAPYNLASQTEVQAIAYAIGRQVAKVCAYADRARVYAAIEKLEEAALDLLAAELRTPAYDEKFPVETKRELIKGTMAFYARFGTPWAVDWVIRTIFGSGQISEWFNYGGEPHHFQVMVAGAGGVTAKSLDEFNQLLVGIKRLSSWLDSIITETEPITGTLRLTAAGTSGSETALPEWQKEHNFTQIFKIAGAFGAFSVTELSPAE